LDAAIAGAGATVGCEIIAGGEFSGAEEGIKLVTI